MNCHDCQLPLAQSGSHFLLTTSLNQKFDVILLIVWPGQMYTWWTKNDLDVVSTLPFQMWRLSLRRLSFVSGIMIITSDKNMRLTFSYIEKLFLHCKPKRVYSFGFFLEYLIILWGWKEFFFYPSYLIVLCAYILSSAGLTSLFMLLYPPTSFEAQVFTLWLWGPLLG